MSKKLRVAVVPEHFSLPWHLGFEQGVFAKHDLDIAVEEYARGTGSMVRSLRTGEIDVAVALTEGVIADIALNGPQIKIVATYIDSPLCWGIVTDKNSPITSVDELRGKNFGISRFGSGSHLMAFLLGDERKWNVEKEVNFVPKGGITDLLEGIKDKSIDTFLWETFTVKPYSDQIKQIGTIVTPWPCFVICVRNEILEQDSPSIQRLLLAIQESCKEFTLHPGTLEAISKKCHLNLEDSKKWLETVRFSDGQVSKRVLKETGEILVKTGALKAHPDIDQLYDQQITTIKP